MSEIYITYTYVALNRYHIAIHYIDNDGNHSVIDAHPFDEKEGIDAASAAISEELLSSNNEDSQFGAVDATERVDNAADALLPRQEIASGNDLSQEWEAIQAYKDLINSEGYEYRPLTQNSNTFARGALEAAGLTIPPLTHTAPGFDEEFSNPLDQTGMGDYDPTMGGGTGLMDRIEAGGGAIGLGAYGPNGPIFGDDGLYGKNGQLFGDDGLFGKNGILFGEGGLFAEEGSPLPDWLNPNNPFTNPVISPLVLDLDGDGLDIISLENSNAYFDLNENGFAEKTAWIAPDDAFLALDINGNGQIDDLSELFGGQYVNGFTSLAQHDDNADGVIDANDSVYSDLLLWQDANGNGISEASELSSLASQGITSIDLEASYIDKWEDGNWLSHESTFESANGSGSIVDIWFENDQVQTIFAYGDNVVHADNVTMLPELVGYGTLTGLHTAMTNDETLRASVETFVRNATTKSYSELILEVEALILDWANVNTVVSDSRGNNIDAQHLGFLEALHGQTFVTAEGASNDPGPDAGAALEVYYNKIISSMSLRFLVQLPLSGIKIWHADGIEVPFVIPAPEMLLLGYNINNNGIVGDFDGLFNVLANASFLAQGTAEYNESLLDIAMLAGMVKNIFVPENGETALQAVAAIMLAKGFSAGDIDFVGVIASAERFEIGTDGDDLINPGASNDVIYGGLGNDELHGNDGSDTYIFGAGDGQDTISENVSNGFTGETDKIKFINNISSADLILTMVGDNLEITFVNSTDKITVIDHFTWGGLTSGAKQIEKFEFDDGTVWTADDIRLKLLVETDGDDVITGFHTDDVFVNSLGNDHFSGRDGDDVYHFNIGDGNDSIDDDVKIVSYSNVDKVIFGNLIAPADVVLEHDGTDLTISFVGASDTLVVQNQFNYGGLGYGSYDIIETYEFSDGTIWTAADIRSKLLESSDGDDNLLGFHTDDTISGGLGDDTLVGRDGDDTYIYNLGDGNDTVEEKVQVVSYSNLDKVVFGAGISQSDLVISTTSKDIIITFIGEAGSLTIKDQFSYSYKQIEEYQFANGDVLTKSELLAIDNSAGAGQITGTTGDDTLYGTTGDDIINAGTGDDFIVGNGGADVFMFADNDGADLIGDFDVSNDKLEIDVVGATSFAGLDLQQWGTNAAIVFDANNYIMLESVDVANLTEANFTFVNAPPVGGTPIEVNGTTADDSLYGTTSDELFNGGAGDDFLIGNGGADVFLFADNDGADMIGDFNVSDDKLEIDVIGETSFAGLDLQQWGTNAAIVFDANNYIMLENIDIANLTETNFTFTNTPAGGGTNVIDGTAGDDQIYGTTGDDIITSQAGDDTVFGYGGDDQIDLGNGDDFAMGGIGDDTFIFRTNLGHDIIGDFNAGSAFGDIVKLEGLGVSSYSQLQTYMSEWAGTTYIDFDANNSITLEGVTMASLNADDFNFV
ncbi:MAG: hypothetical protein HRU29_11895 [Rhizobiales bacterium]|nr:hypothetical protein [Hyphomicrobiales bacterium]NRB15091.1 hypothetical protein [Hyphomicrobiales bacterium]